MCWIGKAEDRKIAKKDIKVYKVLQKLKDKNSVNSKGEPLLEYKSPERYTPYNMGATVSAIITPKHLNPSMCAIEDTAIFEGLHCYSEEVRIVIKNFSFNLENSEWVRMNVKGKKDRDVFTYSDYYDYYGFYEPILVECIIPKGTIYYEDKDGIIVSEKLKLIREIPKELIGEEYKTIKEIINKKT